MHHDPAMYIVHPDPYRPADARSDRPALLMPGDIVTVLFSGHMWLDDQRGTVRRALADDRYCVVVNDETGEDRLYSVPRDLLVLVRRADA